MASLKKLKKFLKPIRVILFITLVLVVLESCAELLLPYLVSILIDLGVITYNRSVIIDFSSMIFIVFFVGIITSQITSYYSAKISNLFSKNLLEGIFDKIIGLSYKNIDELNISNVIDTLTNDVHRLESYLKTGIKYVIKSPIIVVGSFVVGAFLCPDLLFINLAIIVVLAFCLYLIFKKSYTFFYKAQSIHNDIKLQVYETFDGIKTVKIFSNENYEIDKFNDLSSNYRDLNTKANKMMSTALPLISAITLLSLSSLLWFGGKNVINFTYSIGSLTGFILYTLLLIESLITFYILVINFNRANTIANRINDLITIRANITYSNDSNIVEDFTGNIEFDSVSFEFDGSDGINDAPLSNISLAINEGDFVAFLGSSFSGKSTIVNLIARFYDPSSGKVLIGGKDLRSYTEETLKNRIILNLNSDSIFSKSVKSDMGQDNLDSFEDIVTIQSKSTQIDSFMKINPYKVNENNRGTYNIIDCIDKTTTLYTDINENSKVLIIDDSIENINPDLFMKIKKKEIPNLTVIMITEKISSILEADNIFLIDKGQIIVSGNHNKLMKDSIQYQNIYKVQFGEEVL